MEGYLQTNSLTEARLRTQDPEMLWLEGAGAGGPSCETLERHGAG